MQEACLLDRNNNKKKMIKERSQEWVGQVRSSKISEAKNSTGNLLSPLLMLL